MPLLLFALPQILPPLLLTMLAQRKIGIAFLTIHINGQRSFPSLSLSNVVMNECHNLTPHSSQELYEPAKQQAIGKDQVVSAFLCPLGYRPLYQAKQVSIL